MSAFKAPRGGTVRVDRAGYFYRPLSLSGYVVLASSSPLSPSQPRKAGIMVPFCPWGNRGSELAQVTQPES